MEKEVEAGGGGNKYLMDVDKIVPESCGGKRDFFWVVQLAKRICFEGFIAT